MICIRFVFIFDCYIITITKLLPSFVQCNFFLAPRWRAFTPPPQKKKKSMYDFVRTINFVHLTIIGINTMRNLHTTIRENECRNRGCIGSHSYCMYTVATNTVEYCPVESHTLHLCSCQFLISLKLESDRVVGWEVHGVDNGHCSPQLVQGITNHLLTQAHTSLHLVLYGQGGKTNKRLKIMAMV